MIGYLIFWGVSLAALAAVVAYWVRRLDRGHRARMAAIAAAEADDLKRVAETDARIAEYARLAAHDDEDDARLRRVATGNETPVPAGGGQL